MKKLLILFIIVLTCSLTIFVVVRGLHIGSFSILGIQEIKEEDAKLEKKIMEATKLVSTDYPNDLKAIKDNIKEMRVQKQKYQDMVTVSTESEIAASIQKQQYTIDKLWARIGTLATDEGLDAKFVLTKGNLKPAENENYNYYNIEFSVTGSYAGVALYIQDLEEDSELGFRIEDFKMLPSGGDEVSATFKTKDIAIMGVVPAEDKKEEDLAGENGIEESNTTNTTGETKEKKSILNSINSTVTDVTKEESENSTTDTVGQ